MDDQNGIKQLDIDDRNETVESKIKHIIYSPNLFSSL